MLVIPDAHEGHLSAADDRSLAAVGVAIRDGLSKLRRALGDVAYNIVVHALPHHHTDDFHWHVHVVPRVQSIGGFEQGTGVPINIVAPEQATAQLDAAADTRS